MARPDLLPGILPALTPDTIAAVVRDLCGYLATTDRPTSAAAKAMGRALATIRADQHQRRREPGDSASINAEEHMREIKRMNDLIDRASIQVES